ncbi:MAG: hypothetical protein GX633_00910 [Clostridiales bacterium]|nr:hypothetical protein [Clostridiales bacterium]
MRYTIRQEDKEAIVRDKRIEFVKHGRRTVLLAILLTVVLSLYIFRTDMVEAYTSLITRNQMESVEEAGIDRIYFEPDSTNLYSLYNYNLAVLNHGTLKLYTPAGGELLSLQLGFSRPAIETGKAYITAYDRGSNKVYVTEQTSLKNTIETEGSIISLSQNNEGFIAVTRDDEYYRSVVDVYDNSQKLVYCWKTSDYYLLRTVISPDSKQIAVAALTQNEGVFRTKIMFFRLDREEYGSSYFLEGSIATDMCFLDNDNLCVIGDSKAVVVDTIGLEVSSYDFGSDVLKTCDTAEGCAVFALSDRTSGLGSKLVSFSAGSKEANVISTYDAVRKLSVCGNYIAALYTQSVEMFNITLKPYGQPVEVYGVRDLLVSEDGKTLLIYSSEAGYVDLLTPFRKAPSENG